MPGATMQCKCNHAWQCIDAASEQQLNQYVAVHGYSHLALKPEQLQKRRTVLGLYDQESLLSVCIC